MIARPHKYAGPFFFKIYYDLYPALPDNATDHLHHLFTLGLLIHIMVSTGEFEGQPKKKREFKSLYDYHSKIKKRVVH